MPVYVYHCATCGYEFEQQQSFSDKPLKKCPECGHYTLHKVYMPVSVIYKGSGFYSTDHRSNSRAQTNSAVRKEETKADETKSDKKQPVEKEKSATQTSNEKS